MCRDEEVAIMLVGSMYLSVIMEMLGWTGGKGVDSREGNMVSGYQQIDSRF